MLMLSSYAPAAYTLLPHSNGPCPIGYDFVILFLNKQFNFGETTPPPVVNVSQCLNLETCLVGEQARDGSAVRGFYLCSRQKSSMNMVSVEVPHPTEQMEVKRFCDEIDLYEKYQRLSYNCCLDLQSSKGAPIIYQHGEKRNLVGISSSGNQMVTSYGLCQLLAGGPVPLFAAMRHPSPRTLSPFRWSQHILPHLDTGTMTNKGYLLEIFHLLLKKEEVALVNLQIHDPMNVSVTAMELLSKILKKFSGPAELKEVVRESHVFETPNMSEDDFKRCILRVCHKLKGFMHHFSTVPGGANPERILESVFRCTETMLNWRLQYPDAADLLLSNENMESAARATENYQDSKSIDSSYTHLCQCRDSKYKTPDFCNRY